ncbi:PhoU domain containing protein [Desulfovibrio sp. X2]|uniref:PhoU domain-containing protein n=1 Tax=Desulfovibrio sp. X2 TaxID=941449 RepID=UPI00035891CB|nr:PhoU domain-containing protein [Desulfovibrio sp. X2]EPR41940.1 PhoU domain containing protein [Desulfovibrio sp. X2]
MQDLEQNIRFMLLEVTKQMEGTLKALESPSEAAIEKIENRDNYIDNMKSVIENICFSRLHGGETLSKRGVDRLRATHIISNNLERLADHAVNIVRQTRFLTDGEFIKRYEYRPFFDEIFSALEKVYDALFRQDMSLAFKICLSESNLDMLYKKQFDRILNELRAGVETGNLITTVFIFRYLERVGDALLNVGEAIIFYILGEKFKIHQYNALRDTLAAAGREVPISDVEFQSIWGTRSGCRIGRVRGGRDGGADSQGVIFKEGEARKLIQEKINIERWDEIMPGLPPRIVALREEGASASLLLEFLSGCTIQDIVLAGEKQYLGDALLLLEETASEVWEFTKQDTPVNADYIGQCLSRLPDVYRLYPDFDTPVRMIGEVAIPPLRGLLGEARQLDRALAAPFSVFIHGDFNINNIVYDHANQRIHYIDLHRSAQSDYLQDLSVFMVSNFRLPIFDDAARERIRMVISEIYNFGREFARKHGDATYDARLCLGLIRSLLTSVRFELNRKFAKTMYLRGVFLLEKLVTSHRPPEEFRLPLDALFID